MVHLLPILPILGISCLATPGLAPEANSAQATQTAGSRPGIQVILDPVTGEIVNNPTNAQLERLSEGVALEQRRSSWELREFSLPNGGRGVFLDGWADHALSVEVAPDGEVRTVCSQGDQHPGLPATEGENDR